MRAEADLAAMWPQVREIWEAPGAGKGEDEGHSGDCRERGPAGTLILDSQPTE